MEKLDAVIICHGEAGGHEGVFSCVDIDRRKRVMAFLFKRKERLTVLLPDISAACQPSVWYRAALSCYIRSQLWVIFSPFFPTCLNDFISSLPPPHHLSVCLSKTFLSLQLFICFYFSPSVPFYSSSNVPVLHSSAILLSKYLRSMTSVSLCLFVFLVNSSIHIHPKRCPGWCDVWWASTLN